MANNCNALSSSPTILTLFFYLTTSSSLSDWASSPRVATTSSSSRPYLALTRRFFLSLVSVNFSLATRVSVSTFTWRDYFTRDMKSSSTEESSDSTCSTMVFDYWKWCSREEIGFPLASKNTLFFPLKGPSLVILLNFFLLILRSSFLGRCFLDGSCSSSDESL